MTRTVIVTEGEVRERLAGAIRSYGPGTQAAWARAHSNLGERLEVAGDTAFFYCRDTAALLVGQASSHSVLHISGISGKNGLHLIKRRG